MARNGLVLEVTSGKDHFVKSVQIRSFFLVRMQEKYGPEKTTYLDTFYAVDP